MNLEELHQIISYGLPNSFFTLSKKSPFKIEPQRNHLTVETRTGRRFNIKTEVVFELFFDVLETRSWRAADYRYDYKHASYLLPIVLFMMRQLGIDIEEPALQEPTNYRRETYAFTSTLLIEGLHVPDAPSPIDISELSIEENISMGSMTQTDEPELRETVASETAEDMNILNSETIEQDNDAGSTTAKFEQAVMQLREVSAVGYRSTEIHYFTNRARGTKADYFSGEKGNKSYGVVSVSVPASHRSGKVERPFSFVLYKAKENKRAHFVIDEVKDLHETEFFEDLRQKSSGESLMVFIHGFNVSFKNAVYKAAQMKEDFNLNHPMLLMSWPSKGSILAYSHDRETAQYSREDFAEFLQSISNLDIPNIYIVAHSMGSYCLAEALSSATFKDGRFSRLVLAAADIRSAEFPKFYLKKFKDAFEKVALYVSSTDKALRISKTINSALRIGDSRDGISIFDDLDTIDMSGQDTGMFSIRHSYYSEKNSVLDDLYYFLVAGQPASKRRLGRLSDPAGQIYYAVHKR